MVRSRALVLMLVLAAFGVPRSKGADWVLEIEGGQSSGGADLVVADAPEDLEPGRYVAKNEESGQKLGLVVFDDGKARKLAFLDKGRTSTGKKTYTLQKQAPDQKARIAIKPKDDGGADVEVDGHLFTSLRIGERKPYFYPVIGPGGQAVTRHFPMEQRPGEDKDHPHQRSLWFTYGELNGHDFWASDPLNKPNPKFGTIKQQGWKVLAQGPVGVLRTLDEWLGSKNEPLCSDERLFVFAADGKTRILDARLTLRADHGPVHFGDTKEGMFGLRVASSMDTKRKLGGRIVNAEGITDKDAWGKPSLWVDYSGPVEGQTVGIAIFDAPENPRHPTPWHVRDYGLFAANPLGYHDFGLSGEKKIEGIEEGKSLSFHYRVIFHEGSPEDASVASLYEAFANPPKVTVKPR